MLPSMRVADKIRQILKEPKWTQGRVAEELGVSQSTVARWVKGAEPEGDNRDAANTLYERLFGDARKPMVPLMGYVGAGQAVFPINDGGQDLIEGHADAPNSTVAAVVRGDSMLPTFQDGWIIYWSRHLPPSDMINKLCVAQLSDGRILIKTLRRGSAAGFWTLVSLNASDIEDVAVDWAAPIDWIKPR